MVGKKIASGLAGLVLALGGLNEVQAQTSIKKIDAITAQTLFNIPDSKQPGYGLSVTVPFSDDFKAETGFYITDRNHKGELHEDHITTTSFIRANGSSLNGYYRDEQSSEALFKTGFIYDISDKTSLKAGSLLPLTQRATLSYTPRMRLATRHGHNQYISMDSFYVGARHRFGENVSADAEVSLQRGFDSSKSLGLGLGITYEF